MAKNNPTSSGGTVAHGSACNKPMHVQTAHLQRKHKACVPPKSFRRASSCTIVAGPAKPPLVAGAGL